MSAQDIDANAVVSAALQVAFEPCYLAEIARKINASELELEVREEQMAQVASMMADRDDVDLYTVDYQDNGGQAQGSLREVGDEGSAFSTEDDEDGEKIVQVNWEPYTIMHNTGIGYGELDDAIKEVVNPDRTVDQKREIINVLSGTGNDMSRTAERIMQDEMQRQFRNYRVREIPEYNDPGMDFYVEDTDKRDYGLGIEVSVRWENPIDSPYIKSKQDKVFDRDGDLVILAPRFTDKSLDRYEDIENKEWHQIPEGEMTHLHTVPNDEPTVYRPFAMASIDDSELRSSGFPVIVPDGDKVRERLRAGNHVSGNYPLVDTGGDAFLNNLDEVERESRVITESGYRSQVREAIEPLLREFTKPYRIEQYLIDTYWDQGLNTNEIGNLNDVTGRTIQRWLSQQNWGIVTRGTGTPIDDEVLDIWEMMYRGDDPFPRPMTGYEIQALFNRHPFYRLEDWREWYSLSDSERAEIMASKRSPDDQISYTIMLSGESRLFPSYSFIIEKLKDRGVEIREGFFGETGTVYPTQQALEYMINRRVDTLRDDRDVDQRDVVNMRSDLEVQMAEWFSDNELPFAYEPFVVPSSFSVDSDTVSDLRNLIGPATEGAGIAEWRRIYRKHELGSQGDVEADEGFERFSTTEIVPDFVTYPGSGRDIRGADWDGWLNYDKIIELAGAYGVDIVTTWDDWYRVRSVAFKELAFKALGLWQDTYFVIPDSNNVPDDVRNDPHYLLINPRSVDNDLDSIADTILP